MLPFFTFIKFKSNRYEQLSSYHVNDHMYQQEQSIKDKNLYLICLTTSIPTTTIMGGRVEVKGLVSEAIGHIERMQKMKCLLSVSKRHLCFVF